MRGKKKEKRKRITLLLSVQEIFPAFLLSWIGNSSPLIALLRVPDWRKYICSPFLWLFFPWTGENSGLAEWVSRAEVFRGVEHSHAVYTHTHRATRKHFPDFYWTCLVSWSELSSSCSATQEGEKKWFICSPSPLVHVHGLALSPGCFCSIQGIVPTATGPMALDWWCVPSRLPENPKLPACSNSWRTQWALGPAVLWQQLNKHGRNTQMGVARNAACVGASSCSDVGKSKEDKAIRLLFQMS